MHLIGVVVLVATCWFAAATALAMSIGAAIRTAERRRPRNRVAGPRRPVMGALERVVTLATGAIPTIRPVSRGIAPMPAGD